VIYSAIHGECVCVQSTKYKSIDWKYKAARVTLIISGGQSAFYVCAWAAHIVSVFYWVVNFNCDIGRYPGLNYWFLARARPNLYVLGLWNDSAPRSAANWLIRRRRRAFDKSFLLLLVGPWCRLGCRELSCRVPSFSFRLKYSIKIWTRTKAGERCAPAAARARQICRLAPTTCDEELEAANRSQDGRSIVSNLTPSQFQPRIFASRVRKFSNCESSTFKAQLRKCAMTFDRQECQCNSHIYLAEMNTKYWLWGNN
jgi:hypothetical protein